MQFLFLPTQVSEKNGEEHAQAQVELKMTANVTARLPPWTPPGHFAYKALHNKGHFAYKAGNIKDALHIFRMIYDRSVLYETPYRSVLFTALYANSRRRTSS